jgi:hypothetical protein
LHLSFLPAILDENYHGRISNTVAGLALGERKERKGSGRFLACVRLLNGSNFSRFFIPDLPEATPLLPATIYEMLHGCNSPGIAGKTERTERHGKISSFCKIIKW